METFLLPKLSSHLTSNSCFTLPCSDLLQRVCSPTKSSSLAGFNLATCLNKGYSPKDLLHQVLRVAELTENTSLPAMLQAPHAAERSALFTTITGDKVLLGTEE